jgi:hypothetical protein
MWPLHDLMALVWPETVLDKYWTIMAFVTSQPGDLLCILRQPSHPLA